MAISNNNESADWEREKNIARARAAMGGDYQLEKKKRRQLELENRRQAAALAMEDKTHKEKRLLEEKKLEIRRQEAKRAMESPKQKAAREKTERRELEKRQIQEKLRELAASRIREKQLATVREKAAQSEAEKKQEEDRKKYESHLAEANQLIKNITQKEKADLNPYRTLRTDINQTVAVENLTMADIALKEAAKGQAGGQTDGQFNQPKTNKKNLIGLSLVLIFLGAGAIYLADFLTANNQPRAFIADVLILSENQQEIEIGQKNSSSIKEEIRHILSLNPPPNTLTNIYLTEMMIDNNGRAAKRQLGIGETLTKTETNLPVDFTHFLNPRYMMGIDHEPDGSKTAFFILLTKSFENTFDSLLRNEPEIIGQIMSLLKPNIKDRLKFQIFKDKIIKNTAVRIAESEVETVALYAFPDQHILIITETEAVLEKLIDLIHVSNIKVFGQN